MNVVDLIKAKDSKDRWQKSKDVIGHRGKITGRRAQLRAVDNAQVSDELGEQGTFPKLLQQVTTNVVALTNTSVLSHCSGTRTKVRISSRPHTL